MTTAERLEAYDYLAHRLIQLNDMVGKEDVTTILRILNVLAGLAREIRGESALEIMAAEQRHRAFLERMRK